MMYLIRPYSRVHSPKGLLFWNRRAHAEIAKEKASFSHRFRVKRKYVGNLFEVINMLPIRKMVGKGESGFEVGVKSPTVTVYSLNAAGLKTTLDYKCQ